LFFDGLSSFATGALFKLCFEHSGLNRAHFFTVLARGRYLFFDWLILRSALAELFSLFALALAA